MKRSLFILLSILILIPFKTFALIEVDITRGNLNPLPIAVSPLSIDENSRKNFEKILQKKNIGSEISIVVEKNLKSKNKKIISYGATYKSTTVFNYCKIDTNYFHYVTDTTNNKQGKFTPGTHIPIVSPDIGFNDSVDYAFLGAWNFKKEILNKEKKFIKRGGKFITHVPEVKILNK